LASITDKRLSLHKRLEVQDRETQGLKSQLAQLQHLANMGTISYMIAHEMNNLLTPMRSYATLALGNLNDQALVEKALQKAIANAERASKIMESMLALGDGKTQESKTTRLRGLVEEVFTCLARDFAKDGITVNIEIPDELTIQCVPVQIQQVLMNLILNARDAMLARGGILAVKAAEKNDSVEITVADTAAESYRRTWSTSSMRSSPRKRKDEKANEQRTNRPSILIHPPAVREHIRGPAWVWPFAKWSSMDTTAAFR